MDEFTIAKMTERTRKMTKLCGLVGARGRSARSGRGLDLSSQDLINLSYLNTKSKVLCLGGPN
jgi:hypothetical protein